MATENDSTRDAEWTGDLNREQRSAMASRLGVALFDRHRASCERLEEAMGRHHGVSTTTQFFPPEAGETEYAPDCAPWYCDLRFELRDEQPPPRSISGRGPTRTRAVWSAAWAAFVAGELAEPAREGR